jgi:hypothetical protein
MPTPEELQQVHELADALVQASCTAAEALKSYAFGAQLVSEQLVKAQGLRAAAESECENLRRAVAAAEHDRDNAVHRAVLAEERVADLEAKATETTTPKAKKK